MLLTMVLLLLGPLLLLEVATIASNERRRHAGRAEGRTAGGVM